MKLDLGCGNFKLDGYIGIDKYEDDNIDIVLNLDTPIIKLPFEDNQIDIINASHFLEHITNLIPLLNECHRVLKRNGIFTITVPLFPSIGSIKDPTHVRYFIPESFDYFDIDWKYSNQPNYGILKYQVQEKRIIENGDYSTLFVILKKI